MAEGGKRGEERDRHWREREVRRYREDEDGSSDSDRDLRRRNRERDSNGRRRSKHEDEGDNRERRRESKMDSKIRGKYSDRSDGEDHQDEGDRRTESEKWDRDDGDRRTGSEKRDQEELGMRVDEDDRKYVSSGRGVDKRDEKRRDEGRRRGHQRSPESSNSESSGGDRKQVERERGRKKNQHRGSSDDSERSDGEERRIDRGRGRRERERRRREDYSSDSDRERRKRDRRRRDEHRRDRKDRSRKHREDFEDGDLRAEREKKDKDFSKSNGEMRNGSSKEAVNAQREPMSLNANPAGDVATLGRTGGVYIPPFKLARMMKEIEDKSSMEYQRLTWDALRKSINGLVNKVNATNIKNIIPELFSENLIRGRGLFCRSCMKSQMASPGFTDVFAALVAVVNTKFPEIGDLLLRRIILQLKRAYKRNDKPQLIAAVKFIAHLVNQQVAHELVALELLTVLLEQPTDDSVEVAVDFVKECGSILQDLCPKGLHGIFERFRGILHEGEIDKRVQFLIEGLFAIRKAKFQGHPAVRPELDLVEPDDQLTHEVSLDDDIDPETSLDIFRQDPNFVENEKRYEALRKSILGEESEDEDGSGIGTDDDDDDDDDEDDEEDDEEEEERMQIKDATETNLINLRRTIYLTIMSSVDFEEAGHKLLKIKLEPGQEMELCIMLLECCSQERTYLRYYGLLGQRFCMINKVYQENFEKCFVQQYSMIHRLETNKLRNVAKFFAHLLGTDALPWHVLAYIRLTEEDTTSSSRIFIKILFQELSEHLGIRLLNERLNDPAMQESFESIFPRDNPRNTRFSINFFTSIGLGGITENLREYLKNMPRMIMQQQKPESEDESGSFDSGSSSSGSGSSSSESESASSSSDESYVARKRLGGRVPRTRIVPETGNGWKRQETPWRRCWPVKETFP